MTGIVAGSAALIGVALGWWGAVIVALLAVAFLAIGPNRPRWAICVVAAGGSRSWRLASRNRPSTGSD